MSKILKRLYLGDVVKSFGTKQLRKLTTEEPITDTYGIIGTWVFNSSISYSYFIVYIDFECNGKEYKRMDFSNYSYGKLLEYNTQSAGGSYTSTTAYGFYSSSNKKWFSNTYKTITITNIDLTSPWYDSYFETFVTWLKANATKQ